MNLRPDAALGPDGSGPANAVTVPDAPRLGVMDPALPFTLPYRVRFDEAGADGLARPSSLVRYLQDLAWQHSAAAGFDRGWYSARGLGWLVRGLELELTGAAGYGEAIAITTRITGWRRMWCRRLTELAGPDGSLIARARTDWVLLDATGRPVRIPTEIAAFAPHAETFTPTRVDLPEPPTDATTIADVVRSAAVDPMGHLNNAAYLDLVVDAASAAGRPVKAGTRLRLEYLAPALPGMSLSVVAWPIDDGLAVRLRERGGSADLLRATLD